MRRLSGIDASFLYLETPNNHMHIGAVYVFDPSDDPTACSVDRVRRTIENRLHLLPPFRWRLVEVPFGLHHPLWINDPDFDIENHVRGVALPAPGGAIELADYAAQFMARPLDRSRPLWELEVVQGLAGGQVAFITKTHHAAIDGVSGAELTALLLDLSADPLPVAAPSQPFVPDRVPTELEMIAYALRSVAQQPSELINTIRRTTAAIKGPQTPTGEGQTDERPAEERPTDERPIGAALFTAPRASFNVPITPHRTFAYTHVSLADIKAIRSAFGGTVNDVVLAVCASALRRYLLDSGELPAEPLIAMVPMSVRTSAQVGSLGNKITQLLVRLATQEPDPVARLKLIQIETQSAKNQSTAIGAETLSNWAEFAAPAIASRAARFYSEMGLANRHKPIYNVTISNVPGPQVPLYSAGAKLVGWYPMGPIFDGIGLNITVMSYLGNLYFGLLACQDTVNRLWDLAQYVEDAVAELRDAAATALSANNAAVEECVVAAKSGC